MSHCIPEEVAKERAPMFYEGDIVELKSGSPDMTVERIEYQMVFVIWFTQDGRHGYISPMRDAFLQKCLKKVSQNSK